MSAAALADRQSLEQARSLQRASGVDYAAARREGAKADAHDLTKEDALKESERRRTEMAEALRVSEERLKLALSGTQQGLWDWDIVTGVSHVSDEWVAMHGYTRDEVPPHITSWERSVHPDDLPGVMRRLQESFAPDATQLYEVEYRARHKSGDWLWMLSRGRILDRDAEDRPLRMIGTVQDITARKRMEEHLLQAQKMESIGRLAGGIAHDFNNLLAAILGSVELAAMELPKDSPAMEHLTQIREVTEQSALLTRRLLSFARKQAVQPKDVELNEVILRVEGMLRRLIGQDIEIVTARATGLGTIRADPGQVEQILVNLAVNARDAMPSGGTLTIATANVDIDSEGEGEGEGEAAGVSAGRYVRMSVSDTGVGMSEATLGRLFEPFFTTKEVGKGTGLGLATCYGIIKQSGGHIRVKSAPGLGTTFTVYLPRTVAT